MGLFVNNITGSFKDDNYIGITGSVKIGDPGFNGQATHLPAAPVGATFFVSGAKGSANYGLLNAKGFSAFGGDMQVSGGMFLGDRVAGTAYGATVGMAGGTATFGAGLSTSAMHTDDVMLFAATGSLHVMMKNGNQFAVLSGSDGNSPAAGSNTQVQYNANGTLAGAPDFTYNSSTGDLTVGGTTADAKLFFRDSALYLNSSADGKLDIVADEKVDINSTGDNAEAILLEANGGTSETIKIYANQGTTDGSAGAGSILLASDDGGIGVSWNDAMDLWMEGGRAIITANEDAADAIKLHADAGASQTINLLNDAGEGAAAIALTATAGGVDIDAAAGKDVNVAGGQVALVSKDDAASAISLTANIGTSETIVVTNTQGTATDAISLQAAAGGVDIDAASGKDVDIAGGQVLLSSKDAGAGAISLTANQGTTETILVTNSQGTGAGAITLTSTAGGISLTTNASKNITVTSNAIVPASDEGVDLGTSALRFGNIYTGDLHLSNDRGNWTLVEENNMITFRNNYTGKWFRMVMEEIDPTGRDAGMKGAPQGAHRDDVMWDL